MVKNMENNRNNIKILKNITTNPCLGEDDCTPDTQEGPGNCPK